MQSRVGRRDSLYQAVRDYMLQADERIVFRALPRQIAHALGHEARPVLESLVGGVFDGDAVLHWEIVCPGCGGRSEEHDWLRHAHARAWCENCQADFAVHLDSEAQATFGPHPTLRQLGAEADDREFQQTLRAQFAPTTVHELLTVQPFRDWARDQPFPEGEHLAVSRVVIWFSDLAGSTALYAESGDPLGYHLVREHFDVVFGAIHRAEGAVVKTTGDGVMAVFLSGERAVRAALTAHRAMADFNHGHPQAVRPLSLKVGIHVGPAIAVTLNQRLDYFGTSVNVASRLGDLAGGGETVFTEAVAGEPGVQALVTAHRASRFETPVRGLAQPMLVYRVDESVGE